MPEPTVRRWSRRIVHPRLTLTTTDVEATLRQVEACLDDANLDTDPGRDQVEVTDEPDAPA